MAAMIFYLHMKDPHAHGETIEALESQYLTEEVSFITIYGPLQGYRICAGQSVAMWSWTLPAGS